MAARSGQKLKLFYIVDILRKFSDEEHPLTAAEICTKLAQYNVSAERKSVYNDLDQLVFYGFDIIKTRSPKSGFFLGAREFEIPEISLLTDAVKTAKFISPKKTRDLISKLEAMQSTYQVNNLNKGIYFDVDSKTKNEEIYYTIDTVSRAIDLKKQIKFKYYVRIINENKEIKISSSEKIISPYAMTWQDDHYYLIGNYEKYDNLIHLRIDRMHSAEITDKNSRNFSEVSDYETSFDVADYTKRLFGMHTGTFENIELKCSRDILEQVVDRFGDSIFITKLTDKTFNINYKAAVSEALVTWIINFGNKIEAMGPEKLREMIKLRLCSVMKLYED